MISFFLSYSVNFILTKYFLLLRIEFLVVPDDSGFCWNWHWKSVSKFFGIISFDTVRLNEDKIEIILFYGKINQKYYETARLFNEIYPDIPVSSSYVREKCCEKMLLHFREIRYNLRILRTPSTKRPDQNFRKMCYCSSKKIIKPETINFRFNYIYLCLKWTTRKRVSLKFRNRIIKMEVLD